MYRGDFDEARSDRKRGCLGAGVSTMVDAVVVENVGGASVGVAAEEGKLAKGWSGGLVEKRGIRA